MSAAAWCERYVERFGFKLVPLRGKVPIGEAWNVDENLIATVDAARGHWSRNPHDNVGVCLEASGLASLDADDSEGTQRVLAAEGIDLDALIATTPTIIGRAPRLEFKAPPGVKLGRKSVVWPPQAEGEKPVTVLELRGGRVQDVLPPSIHPDTHLPYRWLTPPRDGFPPLPESLLKLWLDFDAFKHRARNLCPWADPEPAPATPPPRPIRERTGPSVIAAFNDAHDAVAILESRGYQRVGKRRWKSPNGHGMAGVVVLPSGKVYCHHASDGLGNGHAHDAFDLFVQFDHGGDFRSAVRAAAQALGLDQGAQHGHR
jgi:putative DNA primase/helicase